MQVFHGTLVQVHQIAMTLAGVAAAEMAGAAIVRIVEEVGTVAEIAAVGIAAEIAAVGTAAVEIAAVGNQRG